PHSPGPLPPARYCARLAPSKSCASISATPASRSNSPSNAPSSTPLAADMKIQEMRLRFVVEFWHNLRIVWPVISALIIGMMLLGASCARLEDWQFGDGAYFALITGFTVGYGDLVPHHPLARVCAVTDAFLGVILTAIVAAAAVNALG